MTDLTPPPIPDGFLSEWCSTLAEGSESPPEAFLPTGLAMLSAVAGPRLVMRWSNLHEERMNLWVLNVGASALARKTSGVSGLKRAVGWIDGDQHRVTSMDRISDAGMVSQLDVVGPDTAAAGDSDDGEPVVRSVPVSWVALFNEISSVWADDSTSWLMAAQKAMLSIYDGKLSSTTKATSVREQDCFVTAIGNIPPGVLREQTTLGMLSSGFVGRWLAIPTPAPTEPVSFPMPDGDEPVDRLRRTVRHMASVAALKERVIVNGLWTPDAIYMRDEWYREAFFRHRSGSSDDAILAAESELWGRLQATAVKLATLLAFGAQYHRVGDLRELRVSCDEVAWASQVVDASIGYVTEALRSSGADSVTAKGKVEGRILRFLERQAAIGEASGKSFSDVGTACKGRDSRAEVTAALDALASSGHVAVRRTGRGGTVWLPAAEEVREAA